MARKLDSDRRKRRSDEYLPPSSSSQVPVKRRICIANLNTNQHGTLERLEPLERVPLLERLERLEPISVRTLRNFVWLGGHLANGISYGRFDTMKTTIDRAGRLVIPKDIRRESGIKPGMPLEVRWEKGAIAITPAPLEVKLERKGRLLVAVPAKDTSRLSADTVERTRKSLRKERSGDAVWRWR
jgi:AbrB family looped-hinge helix DNA binding protein